MNITEFLLARIAEDEAAARAAFDEPFLSHADNGVWEANTSSRSPNVRGTAYLSIEGGDPDFLTEGQAAHMARHDPARVLRECAAKRAIMGIHSDRDGDCARCSDYAWFAILDGGEHEEFPCPTIRHLAAVYADHPDYQPEWALQQ